MIRMRIPLKVSLALLLTVATVMLLPELVAGRGGRQGAAAWIATHPSSLPTTLEELEAVPTEFRMQVAWALTPEAQSTLWRAQYRRLLQTRLTETQTAAVTRLVTLLTPETYRAASRGLRTPQLDEAKLLCKHLRDVFQAPRQRRVFNALLPEDNGIRLSWKYADLVWMHLGNRLRLMLRVAAEPCHCNSAAGDGCKCPARPDWFVDGCNCGDCTPTYWGCGCSGLMSCVEPCTIKSND
jgi:hypothetical protein